MPMYDDGSYGAIGDEPPPPAAYSAQLFDDDYGWIDRADALWDAIGDSPPDYSFAFEGAEPWAWETGDGHWIVVEDGPQGISSYYFEPQAGGPFLAVEPGRSFGYDGAAVAVVYGPDGRVLARDEGAQFLGDGATLYARARQLRRAIAQRQWRPVDAQAWIDASPLILGFVQQWDEGRQRHPGWRRHRDIGRDLARQQALEQERLRRRGLSAQFRHWRDGGFQGQAPGRYARRGTGRTAEGDTPRQPGAPRADRPRRPDRIGPPGSTVVPPQTWSPAGESARPERGPRRPGAGREGVRRPEARPRTGGDARPERRGPPPESGSAPRPSPPPRASPPPSPGISAAGAIKRAEAAGEEPQ
ncbi:hypothetical protein [Sphingomonas sp. M1-B02]|uniref:hypothetical protein n=1 Tax=Sphingomonas sp. M1-B02 TaxID=3114300 RepID=UPI002240E195|nr:hypothetical protein [Sphingomonas sp. S6-11]UZK65974.1 hypothetical protein OKW87_15920 [Sphingomonas sp. S6-11]